MANDKLKIKRRVPILFWHAKVENCNECNDNLNKWQISLGFYEKMQHIVNYIEDQLKNAPGLTDIQLEIIRFNRNSSDIKKILGRKPFPYIIFCLGCYDKASSDQIEELEPNKSVHDHYFRYVYIRENPKGVLKKKFEIMDYANRTILEQNNTLPFILGWKYENDFDHDFKRVYETYMRKYYNFPQSIENRAIPRV